LGRPSRAAVALTGPDPGQAFGHRPRHGVAQALTEPTPWPGPVTPLRAIFRTTPDRRSPSRPRRAHDLSGAVGRRPISPSG
jgi:hypothetical protein